MLSSSRTTSAPRQLSEDSTREILLRFPPDDPASLVRASRVCRRWRDILADPAFRRDYRAFHRTPPLLGLIRNNPRIRDIHSVMFTPTTAYRPSALQHPGCSALDCRHGRVLLEDSGKFTLWNPVTGAQHCFSKPKMSSGLVPIDCNAVLLCAAGMECDHLSCFEGHFRIALVTTRRPSVIDVSLYTSENDTWSKPSSRNLDYDSYCLKKTQLATIAGSSIFFSAEDFKTVLQYHLQEHSISVIQLPRVMEVQLLIEPFLLIPINGALGFAHMFGKSLYIWSFQTSTNEGSTWVKQLVLNLEVQLPERSMASLLGYADVANSLILSTHDGVFNVNISSSLMIKVCDSIKDGWRYNFPYLNFAFPALRAAFYR